MGNEIVSKKTVAQFVHDAVEMETAIFTLDKLKRECNKRKEDIIEDAKREYDYALGQLKEAEQNLKHTEEKGYISPIQEPQNVNSEAGCSGCLFAPLISFGIVIAVLFVVVVVNSFTGSINTDEFASGVGVALFIILSIVIYFIWRGIFKWSDKKDNAKAMNKFQQDLQKGYQEYQIEKEAQIQKCHEEILRCRVRLENAEKSRQIKYEQANLIDLQIKNNKEKTQKIKSNLANLYSYDIIPPDYRYMDCVIMLDQIFRNDLADTMREAIKIYEERVFRGSVIRGMDKIVSMLGKLSSDMSAISLRLDMINNNVAHMSSDLNRFNERIASEGAKNRAATEDLIRETQLGRYTNEKLLESNKRLEYYAEEYRMGRMPIK